MPSTHYTLQSENDNPDWETIYGVLENAIYGGRMDNSFDVRLLCTYLRYCSVTPTANTTPTTQTLLQRRKAQPREQTPAAHCKGRVDSCNVQPTGNVTPTIPIATHHLFPQEYLDVIQQLPEIDYPATFGLPANADRTVQREKVRVVMNNLHKLREVVDVSKMSKSEWEERLTPITQKWTTMCTPNADALQRRPHKQDNPGPVDGYIYNELVKAHELIETVDHCMDGIDRVIKGASLLTAELKKDAASLLANTIPMRWQQFECPEETEAYLQVLVVKAVALSSWYDRAQSGTILTSKLRLGDLLRPTTFLNALRQQTAKITGKSVVDLVLSCSWTGSLEGCGLPTTVEGLHIQGAKMVNAALTELSTDDPSWHRMPDLTLGYIPSSKVEKVSGVQVPVYVSRSRESLLCELLIPCPSVEADSWILSGLALVV